MSAPHPNPSAGTQVVSRIEIRGSNHSLVHPRGAVGILTRTPAVAGENYLVRFPDGFESTLARDQFEILKHFKDRLGAPASGPASAVRAGSETAAPPSVDPSRS